MERERIPQPARYPEAITSLSELLEVLSRPTPGLVEAMRGLDGDILILGAGGKMGPTLAIQAARAVEASGVNRRVIGAGSFRVSAERARLEEAGVHTIQVDLSAPGALDTLPDAANVVYMVGRKFGSTGAEWATWMTNVHVTGLAARRYARSKVVAFSSGNIYPFVPVGSGGATEETPPNPVGEYAMTCLGRERMFDFCANEAGARVLHFRLNYAVELRYGIVLDVATKVWNEEPIDVTMGHVNVVWQGHASAVALQCFALASAPAMALNVTGPELVSVRGLAKRLGSLMGKEPRFCGEEAPTALLSNAGRCHNLFGHPEIGVERVTEWVAEWVKAGGVSLNKPTHFETRDGRF